MYGKAVRPVLPGNPGLVTPSRYRFDSKHITKLIFGQDAAHFDPVAVTLDPGGPLARSAIVDASRVSRVPDGIRQVRVCPTVFWRR